MNDQPPPINNGPTCEALLSELDGRHLPMRMGIPRRRVTSDPCLPARLPSNVFMQREARDAIPKKEKELAQKAEVELETSTPTSPTVVDASSVPERTRKYSTSSITSFFSTVSARLAAQYISGKAVGKEPEAWQVREAIDRGDPTTLMAIRDRAFHLLLENFGGDTPLKYAIRTDHEDMAIVLLGAFSRYINYLSDEDMSIAEVRTNLRLIRINLKIAIDEGLMKSQTNLTASFMQTLVMSEGDKWVNTQVSNLKRELRIKGQKPVETAGTAVWAFATQKLIKADLIASLEDYIGNATVDLLMLAAWALALEKIEAHGIPTYYFARDDRVYKVFVDLIHKHRYEIKQKLDPRLRQQLFLLRDTLEGRALSYRRKVQQLVEHFDQSQ